MYVVIVSNDFFFMQSKKSAEANNLLDTIGIDKTVRPQDDFFNYVNGDWIKENRNSCIRIVMGHWSNTLPKYTTKPEEPA